MADTKNVVLVTGANTDMGWELVKSLLQFNNPYHIFLGCRSIEKREAGIKTLHTDVPTTNSTVELFRVGLESDDSISSAFEKVKPELSGMAFDRNGFVRLFPIQKSVFATGTVSLMR